uniref:Putative treslin n=2 Tax=Helianthus annuus TaxID=4232 RepID=A0A251VTY2_HELAN
MADAIDFSKTHRIVLLIDLNPLLQNPNPNFLTSLLATSKILLSFPSLSSSLFSFKFFFSSLSTLLSASTLHRILPHHSSASLSFNSPSQTLDSLSNTLSSISVSKLPYSPSNCSHTAASLLQLLRGHDWESDFENVSGKSYCDPVDIRSNLIILLSPVCRSSKSLAEFMCVDVSNNCLDGCRRRFRDCFRAVSDAFNGKDIQFCWVDVCSHVEEPEISESDFIQNEISKFGWGFCSADFIVLGSALVSFGLIYPNIAVSSRLIDSCRLDKRVLGQLELEILDVSGKPLECKFCDLELLRSKASPKPRFNGSTKRQEVGSLKAQRLNSLNTFLGSFNDEIMKLHITSVQKHTEYEHVGESSSNFILVQSAESGQKGKDGLDNSFTDRVFELLAGEKSELFAKHTVPTWQIFLSFLYKEGYWALLSLSNGKGDSYMGILKPFTIHSAVLSLVDNNHNLVQNACGTNLLINKNVSQVDIDPQMSVFPLGKYGHVGDGKRRKMKKHMYRELTWSSFCKAAYEFLDVDLAEIYYSYGMQKSKTLKFLKCWMKEVKKHRLSLNNTPPGPCQTGPDLNQQKETDKNKNFAANANYQESDEPFQMHICSDKSRMQDDDALVSCSETSESFFRDLPKKIQHGVESIGVDLKILAERLVSSSLYWLHKKHETMKNLDESCTIEVAEIIKLLLCEPQDMKEHKDYNSSSASEYLVREYELQILLRLEILQSKYVRGMKGSMRMKLVKQICSLLEIIQYLVEGGFHGDLSLYDYVERTIKSRYSKNLGDVIDKIYDQMDLLPFGEENEDQALMINDEDSIQSWREKHERNDMSASKMIQDSLSVEVESCHLLEKVNTSREGQTKEDHARMLNEARERRERARRFAYFTRRMPDLQRVWAPKQSTAMKVKPEPKRKKQMGVSYSVVCETPFGNKPSCPTGQNKSERATPVSKALFQDDR